MKYNRYIKELIPVSEIGLGAWQLGVNSGWKSLPEPEANAIVRKALELGINFFDTAPNYGLGTGEERLGKALKDVDRDSIVINTKFGHTDTGGTNYDSSSLKKSLEGSLRRLQVDYVDSLILHNPPTEFLDGNKTDHYEILERLVEEGKVKAYGASLDTAADMKLLMSTTNAQVIEAFFNILHQDTAKAFALAEEKKVGIIAKIPLDSGWLSGKYHAESTFEGVRSRWSAADIRVRALLVDQIKALLQVNNNLTQKAIAFCLSYGAVSTVIPGNMSIAQLTDNVNSINHPLSKDEVKKLE